MNTHGGCELHSVRRLLLGSLSYRSKPGGGALALSVALYLGPGPLAAQTGADTAAAGPITAATIARHTAILAHDSFRDRDTPSPALTRAAQYVAAQFQQFGLAPGYWPIGNGKSKWLNGYELPGHRGLDETCWNLHFRLGSRPGPGSDGQGSGQPRDPADTVTAAFTEAVYFTVPLIAERPNWVDDESQGTWLISGRHTAASLKRLALRGQTVLYVPPAELDSAARQQIIDQLYAQSLGVVVLETGDSSAFARAHAAARQHPPVLVDLDLQNALRPHGWVVHIWAGRLTRLLARAGLDLARLTADHTPVARPLPLQVDLGNSSLSATPPAAAGALNVTGWLEGRDSMLHQQYVLVMAHLDEIGGRPLVPDSLRREPGGAGGPGSNHDNRAGVAGLLALAEAFSRLEPRPRRSLVFVATSGGAKPEFWGAARLAGDWYGRMASPMAPQPGVIRPAVVSVLNLDALDAPGGDSVLVAGLREGDDVPAADWVAAAHPELGLQAVDGGSGFVPASDHFAFSRLGVPLLYFHTGAHGRSVVGAPPAPVAAEQTARMTRLAFYVARELAEAAGRPRLNAVGRQRYLASGDRRE